MYRNRGEFLAPIQGRIVKSDSDEEQGGVLDCSSADYEMELYDSIPSKMARYPSNEEFDADDALKTTFGLSITTPAQIQVSSGNSESDQLGVGIDNLSQNEMERPGFESYEF